MQALSDHTMETVIDTLKVGAVITTVSTMLEFVDGWGKIIAWAIGMVYVIIKIANEVKRYRNG